MKHAPGPYSYVVKRVQVGSPNRAICVVDANGRNIATVYGRMDGEKEATAKLFTLAPEMAKLILHLHDTGKLPRLLDDHENTIRRLRS